MKIAVYSDHAESISLEAMLRGETPSSGSLSSINAFTKLGSQHEVVVFHRLHAPRSLHLLSVDWIQVKSGKEFVSAAISQEYGCFDIAIVRNHPELYSIAEGLHLGGIPTVAMLNNDLSPNVMRDILTKGVARFAVRSKRSIEYYKFMPFAEQVHLVRHAVPFHFQYPAAPPPRVEGRALWVGATREEKGFHLLLAAWPEVKRVNPKAELHVFGSIHLHVPEAEVGWSGVMTPEFEKQHLEPIGQSIQELRSAGIAIHGATPKKEIFDFALTSMVGVVNPNVLSATETFCMSAIEIQAAGCPCIGGYAGGLMETIDDGVSGILVRSEKPDDLSRAILHYINGPDQFLVYSEAARAHAHRFLSLEEESAAWNDLFKRYADLQPSPASSASFGTNFVRGLRSISLSKLAGRFERKFFKR